jgi:hypothetical protein
MGVSGPTFRQVTNNSKMDVQNLIQGDGIT